MKKYPNFQNSSFFFKYVNSLKPKNENSQVRRNILDISEDDIHENNNRFDQKSNKKFQIIINPKPKTEIKIDLKQNNLKKKPLVDYYDDEEEKYENGFIERKIILIF